VSLREFHADDLRGEPGDFRLPARFDSDVAGSGSSTRPRHRERGGRLRLQTRATARNQARAKCVVRDASGAPVARALRARADRLGRQGRHRRRRAIST
jgi:hypothetical protein